MISRILQRYICLTGIITLFIIFFYQLYPLCLLPSTENVITATTQRYILDEDVPKYPRNRSMPLIFVGSMPRSGTTLMRAMLDAHPDIRCGEETRVIPRILGIYREEWQSPFESKRLKEAGIEGDVLDNAIAAFILEVIARHGEPAPWLCNKDPFSLLHSMYLHSLFPKAKFILMLRDGRAVVHSIVTRKVSILGFDITDYRQCLIKWNDYMYQMYNQCINLGPDICMPVHYEQLVLQPKRWMESILNFLHIPWHDTVLHHDKLIGKPGGISLSKLERSSDQVIKPVNIEALSKWVGQIPDDVVRDMAIIAPMLANLGYDPYANPPNYGKPDDFVLKNTYFIKENQNLWAEKEQELEREKNLFKESLSQKYGHKIEAI